MVIDVHWAQRNPGGGIRKKIPKASSTGKLQRAAEPGEKGTLQEGCIVLKYLSSFSV